MSNGVLIVHPTLEAFITTQALTHAAERDLSDHARTVPITDRGDIDLQIHLDPADGPGFEITHFTDDTMLSVNGTPEQNATTAAWIRSILPPDLDLYAIDEAGTTHVLLHHDITAQQITTGWTPGLPPSP